MTEENRNASLEDLRVITKYLSHFLPNGQDYVENTMHDQALDAVERLQEKLRKHNDS